jgi:hypothetical protein
LKWDIILPRGNQTAPLYSWFKGVNTHTVNRAKMNSKARTNKSIRVLSSPSDIEGWRKKLKRKDTDSERGALFLYAIDKDSKGRDGKNCLFDDPKKGTDVIGLAFVFPGSHSEATVEYVTQEDGI